MDGLADLTAARQIAPAVAVGMVKATDVVESSLARIAVTEPLDNAFIAVLADDAREHAVAIDEAVAAEARLPGPLLGVPVGVKDVFDVEGTATTCGSELLTSNVARADGEVAARLRQAGAVIVGKTNMDEFAFSPNQRAFGRTNCPADRSRFAGGSSAGSAAAVANGSVPVSVGTDAGGSVRYPAAVCGVVGFKPTFGAFGPGMQGRLPELTSLDYIGLIGGHVADVALLRSALGAGPVAAASEERAPVLVVPPRWREGCSGYIAAAVDSALLRLAAHGARIIEKGTIDFDAAFDILVTIVSAEAHRSLTNRFDSGQLERLPPAIRELLALGAGSSGQDYRSAQDRRQDLRGRVTELFTGAAAVVLPAVAKPALSWDDPHLTDWSIARYLPVFNLTGHPAITIPLPVSGLPAGLQIVGPLGGDAELLGTAQWAESVLADGLK